MNRIKHSLVAFGSRSLPHFMMFIGTLVLAWLGPTAAMAQFVLAPEPNPAAGQSFQLPQPCERERRPGCPAAAMAEQSFLFPQSWAKELTLSRV
jgi:hypothetical protein